jgi:hypothetical protein
MSRKLVTTKGYPDEQIQAYAVSIHKSRGSEYPAAEKIGSTLGYSEE